MNLPMPTLTRAKNGDWFARKAIPAVLRERYGNAHRVNREELFRWPSSASPAEAKRAYGDWLSRIEGQIEAVRTASTGRATITLTHRELHDLAGRWYLW